MPVAGLLWSGVHAMQRVDESLQAEASQSSSALVERLQLVCQEFSRPASPQTAKAMNDVLASLVTQITTEEKAEVARCLLTVLDAPHFKAAVDVEGVSCRARAVSVLLKLGYPWALQLHPDDLAFYRARPGASRRRWVMGLMVLLAVGFGVGAWYFGSVAAISRRPISSAALSGPVSLSGLGVEDLVVEPEARALPAVKSAQRALLEGDPEEALRSVAGCTDDACFVLKIIALYLRDRDGDWLEAAKTLTQLQERSSSNPALPRLERLMVQGNSRRARGH